MKSFPLLFILLCLMVACGEDQNQPPDEENNTTKGCPPNQVKHPQLGVCVSLFADMTVKADMSSDMPDEDMSSDMSSDMSKMEDMTQMGCMRNVYVDADGDGFGAGAAQLKCVENNMAPEGFSLKDGDCDDMEPNRAPDLEEACDALDNNCNNTINENITCQFYAHTDNNLFLVDPFKKTATQLGGIPELFDMDTDVNGQLYGISSTKLYRFDQNTNSWSEVGGLGVAQMSGANGFAILRQGTAFVTAGNELFTIDLATGQATRIGAMGGAYKSSGDCVVNKGDVLFMTSSRTVGDDLLVQIDGQDARATTIGDTKFKQIYALTSAWGTLFGLTGTGQLVQINTRTGEGALIHTFPNKSWYGAASSPQR